VEEGEPLRATYEIRGDARWRVRSVTLRLLNGDDRAVRLLADGEGRWTTDAGAVLSALHGCVDVDISATPFTNTLPIRRLALEPGASAELRVAYLSVPDLGLSVDEQRYTCLERHARGARFKYESLDTSGFTAEVTVDADGLVTDYSGLFRRIWSDGRETMSGPSTTSGAES
jgi:uncharacterized protein